jgi:hypothetical protein
MNAQSASLSESGIQGDISATGPEFPVGSLIVIQV